MTLSIRERMIDVTIRASDKSMIVKIPSRVETKSEMLLAKVTIMLILGLIALGLDWYGFSRDVLLRIWHDVVDRPSGPMAFRFCAAL
jgi:hypothetical protein